MICKIPFPEIGWQHNRVTENAEAHWHLSGVGVDAELAGRAEVFNQLFDTWREAIGTQQRTASNTLPHDKPCDRESDQ